VDTLVDDTQDICSGVMGKQKHLENRCTNVMDREMTQANLGRNHSVVRLEFVPELSQMSLTYT
jgi:hypothetical protein